MGLAGATIARRGPQRGCAARPAYAPAGPGTPARPSPADASLHPNAHRCALGAPALGALPRRLPGAGRSDCQRACGAEEFRGLSAPALLPEQMARPPRSALAPGPISAGLARSRASGALAEPPRPLGGGLAKARAPRAGMAAAIGRVGRGGCFRAGRADRAGAKGRKARAMIRLTQPMMRNRWLNS